MAVGLWCLFAWSFREALSAGIGALAIYVGGWLFEIVTSPSAAFGGFLFRVLIIGALFSGTASEWSLRRRARALAAARRQKQAG